VPAVIAAADGVVATVSSMPGRRPQAIGGSDPDGGGGGGGGANVLLSMSEPPAIAIGTDPTAAGGGGGGQADSFLQPADGLPIVEPQDQPLQTIATAATGAGGSGGQQQQQQQQEDGKAEAEEGDASSTRSSSTKRDKHGFMVTDGRGRGCGAISSGTAVDWILGNHADELTPWIPLMTARTSRTAREEGQGQGQGHDIHHDTRWWILPCCFWGFSAKFEYNVSHSQPPSALHSPICTSLCRCRLHFTC